MTSDPAGQAMLLATLVAQMIAYVCMRNITDIEIESMPLTIAVVIFLILGGAIALFGYHRHVRPGNVYESLTPVPADTAVREPVFYSVTSFVESIGSKIPPPAKITSRNRMVLIAAGYRSANAPAIDYGAKLALMAAFGSLAFFVPFRMKWV